MLKLFRPTRFKVTLSAMTLALAAGAVALMLSAEPAYACSPGGGGLDRVTGVLDWIFGWK